MRTVAVVALLGLVLTASALDLALGVLWVVALVAVLLLRRRLRMAAVLVLLASAALLVWGSRLGWFASPIPVSYERGWVPAWGEPRPAFSTVAGDPQLLAARARLAELTREELRLTGSELEQRAGAVIALSRRLDPLRGDAPREAAAVEAAARRLARTLAAAEFRDLEARRAAVSAYLVELDRRLGTARDGSEAASVLRAADPATMAHVSLRPVREDLAAASAAVEALVRVLGGGVPTAATTATARYDDSRKELRREVRYAVTGAPGVRLLRVELRAFRGTGAIRGAREPRVRGWGRGRAPGSARRIARSRAGSARRGDRPSVGRARGSAPGARDLPPARVRAARGRSRRDGRRRPDHGRSRRAGGDRDTARRAAPAASPGSRRGATLRALLREPARNGHARSGGRELGASR